jgi:hypothetical protein
MFRGCPSQDHLIYLALHDCEGARLTRSEIFDPETDSRRTDLGGSEKPPVQCNDAELLRSQ